MNVIVAWPTFGPYHHERLEAAIRVAAGRGDVVVGLETASRTKLHPYDEARRRVAHVVTLFPGRTFEELRTADIRRKVWAVLDELDPDVVATNSYAASDARAMTAWCLRKGRSAVVMTDSTSGDAPRQLLRERAKSLVLRSYGAAFVAGRRSSEYLMTLGFDCQNVFQGCNVVDNQRFARSAVDHPKVRADKFVAMGRFISRKNFSTLIHAYARYRREVQDDPWDLCIVGDGPLRKDLEAFADSLGVSVLFPGYLGVDEVVATLHSASAFVHPALSDPWGLVVNEAMAAALPVIVSRQSGCAPDLVEPGVNGFVFDASDTRELEATLRRATHLSPGQRASMGRRSAEIISEFSLARWGETLLASAEHAACKPSRRRLLSRAALRSADLRYRRARAHVMVEP